MSNYSILKSLFQSGEISPYFGGRTDSDVYNSGVAWMQNALPHPLGGFRKRPGTHYLVSPLNTYLRFIELYTDEKTWTVLMSAGHFYLLDATADNPTVLCNTSNPYTAKHIDEIKFRANKGVLYLVHHQYKPATLSINKTVTYAVTADTTVVSGKTYYQKINNVYVEVVNPTGNPHAQGYYEITATTYSLTFAYMTFVTDTDPNRCVDFNSDGNYPSAITFKGGRLFFGSTDNEPTTTFASRTPSGGNDRYNDFTLYDNQEGFSPSTDQSVVSGKIYYTYSGGVYTQVTSPTGNPAANGYYEWTVTPYVTNSHAFEVQENDMYGTKILWYVVQNRLICGNSRSVLMDNGSAATPESFDLVVTLNTGAADIQAKVFKNYACYAGASGKSLHLMVWDEDAKGYTTIEISKGSSHMLKDGIVDFDIMLDPEPLIWVLTKTGELLSCLVDTSTGTTGWARHPRSRGKYEALCVTGLSHSRLMLEVVDNNKHHLEYFEILETDDISDSFYTDCSTVFDFAVASNKIEVNPALAGYSVTGFCDNSIMPTKTATLDTTDNKVYVTYDIAVKKGYIGLPIDTIVHLFPPEIPANGTSQGKKRRINKVTTRLYESFGGGIGIDPENLTPLLTRRYGVYKYGTPVSLVSEDLEAEISSKNTKDGSVYVVHDEPVPFNLLSMVTKYELLEV